MKLSSHILIILMIVGLFSSTPLFAEDDEDLESYITECSASKVFYDPTVMAETMADPAKFISFISEMNKPATAKSAVECMAHPEQWGSVVKSMTDYNNYAQGMLLFMNPQMYMNWMAASMNPQTYTQLMTNMNPTF